MDTLTVWMRILTVGMLGITALNWTLVLRRWAGEGKAGEPLLSLARLPWIGRLGRIEIVSQAFLVPLAHVMIYLGVMSGVDSAFSQSLAGFGLMWLSAAAREAAIGLSRDQVTERGLFVGGGLIPWDRIRLYRWEKGNVLALIVRPGFLRPSVQRVRIADADRPALEPLLARYVSHSVPSRDEETGHAPDA